MNKQENKKRQSAIANPQKAIETEAKNLLKSLDIYRNLYHHVPRLRGEKQLRFALSLKEKNNEL